MKNLEINVWVGDLERYNAGELVGEWFTLPMELSEILDEVLIEGNEEYFIGDTDSELDIRNMSFNEMNELAEKLETLDKYEAEILAKIWDSGYFSDVEEAVNCVENGEYFIYHDCKDMSDVAYTWYEETGQLAEISKHIEEYYIDFDRIGNDMEINGYFYQVDNNTFVQIMA